MPRSPAYTDLEIVLQRGEGGVCQAELRFSNPHSDAEVAPVWGPTAIDPEELLPLQGNPAEYGQRLTSQLFDDSGVRELFGRARVASETAGFGLRVRLTVGPSVPELQALRWELLNDPESKTPLATSEKILFSRFMLSQDWRPVRLRSKERLRALVAVAAPSDVEEYGLAAVNADGEIKRARASLADIEVGVVGREESLTLNRLVDRLRDGIDVLYLVCHGVLHRKTGEPVLFLQAEDGTVERVRGADLAQRISELVTPPRLAVLASCESAATETGDLGQGALAPRLAAAGLPAVVAMQGQISMRTVEEAMPVFFQELLADGQIDRALAVARGRVRERSDFWMPALYLRLRGGRIWYEPGFAGEGDEFQRWHAIVSSVRQGSFIPIIGPDVDEHFLGRARDFAVSVGQDEGFPLEKHERADLAKVAQYLSVDQSPKYARDKIVKQMRLAVAQRFPEIDDAPSLSFPKLLDAVIERWEDEDPFKILADLPASVYVTSSGHPMLLKALKAAGKEPAPLLCDWRPSEENHPREPSFDGELSRQNPIVYHVFGVLGKATSLVLTEDDFFDYLIATAEYKLIPTIVRGALTRSSLLFLGFQLNDWRFRVLFRMIINLGGSHQLRDFAHVGVQVDPDEGDPADVERARKYLEQYYGSGYADMPQISIYWGSAADFLKELQRELLTSSAEEYPTAMEDDEDDWLG